MGAGADMGRDGFQVASSSSRRCSLVSMALSIRERLSLLCSHSRVEEQAMP